MTSAMGKNVLYVIKKDDMSEEAIRILESLNINFTPIVVGLEGAGKFMWRDTRTCDLPLLLTSTNIYCGLDEISRYAYAKH